MLALSCPRCWRRVPIPSECQRTSPTSSGHSAVRFCPCGMFGFFLFDKNYLHCLNTQNSSSQILFFLILVFPHTRSLYSVFKRFAYFYFMSIGVFACVYICVPCECNVPGGYKTALDPRTGVRDPCELSCRCCEQNLNALHEQPMFQMLRYVPSHSLKS